MCIRDRVYKVSIPAGGAWTVITLPNLPVWPGSSNWSLNPGSAGYEIGICLGAGTTFQAAALGSWQAANVLGFAGQNTGAGNNFLATANALCTVAFVQHEPGASCSTLIDKPFTQNLDECLRYYCKSYDYGVAPGTVSGAGMMYHLTVAGANPLWPVSFPKIMAKTPTMTGYSGNNGLINAVYDASATTNRGISAPQTVGVRGFGGFSTATQNAANANYQWHWTADTSW